MARTVRVGIAGLGFMGQTHLQAYLRRSDVEVVALADQDPARLRGEAQAASNIAGVGQPVARSVKVHAARRHADVGDLIADPRVELVDICLPTLLHATAAEAALAAGKHVLVEKPVARTATEAHALADRAAAADTVAMPAMCMRFWPGWTWLKRVVDERSFGRVRSVHFQRRGAALPGMDYRDGARSGGALLDLHIHDADFVLHLFGRPRTVTSHGYSHLSGAIDHVETRYACEGADLVVAEGAWIAAPSFPFVMRYMANFEHATAVYDLAATPPLLVYRPDREPETVPLEPGPGYDHEIDYLIACIQNRQMPEVVTLRQAADAVTLVEAEARSVETGKTVSVEWTR